MITSMAWQTPKTDWYGGVDAEGNYSGDRFNASDFNRIKNNLVVLTEMRREIDPDFGELGSLLLEKIAPETDRTESDYFFADEIQNMVQYALEFSGSVSDWKKRGLRTIYSDNEKTMTFEELNALENTILNAYENLRDRLEGRRMFTWNFGMKGSAL